MDLSKFSDKELAALQWDAPMELARRKQARCKHDFQVAWNYHKNEEDNYSVCRKCQKIT